MSATTPVDNNAVHIDSAAAKRQSLRLKRRESLAGWLMISPALLLILTFLILPIVMGLGFSFTNQRLISPNPTEFVGLRNFESLFRLRMFPIEAEIDLETGDPLLDEEGNIVFPRVRNFVRGNPDYPQLDGLQESFSWVRGTTKYTLLAGDAVFVRSLVNIFYFIVVVIPVQGGLALILAILVNQKLRGINIFRTIYFVPVVISMVIVSILWRFIYDGNNGLLNSLLGLIPFINFQPIDWIGNQYTAMPAIIMMSIWQGVGFHMVIWLAGLQTIPGVLYEAADVAGATTWQKFRYVTWPGLAEVLLFLF